MFITFGNACALIQFSLDIIEVSADLPFAHLFIVRTGISNIFLQTMSMDTTLSGGACLALLLMLSNTIYFELADQGILKPRVPGKLTK